VNGILCAAYFCLIFAQMLNTHEEENHLQQYGKELQDVTPGDVSGFQRIRPQYTQLQQHMVSFRAYVEILHLLEDYRFWIFRSLEFPDRTLQGMFHDAGGYYAKHPIDSHVCDLRNVHVVWFAMVKGNVIFCHSVRHP
jgi:hypothetical protein